MKYDVGIIGSGPAGLSAAIYAKRANLSAVVIEKEYEGTGQIAESGRVDNYLGMPGISGYDLGVFADGSQVEAKTVIYAAGATPQRANIPGEQEYAGKGVSYCAICDGSFYRGKSVAVLGGGDTALDDAVYLADVAEKVYVIHRRKEFRGAAVTVAKLREKENVIFVLEHQVKEIIGEQKVTGVVLEDATVIDVNGVFVAYGAVPQTDLLKKFAVLDDSGYVRAGETGETALEGLYVAGDARTKKLRQVVTAVSDGANAATAVAEYLK